MIKKTLCFAAAVMLLAANGFACEKGVKIGFNQGTLICSYPEKKLNGFAVGLSGGFHLFGNIFFQPEFHYTRLGTGTGLPEWLPDMRSCLRIDYLQVPALVKWRFSSRKVVPILLLGVYGAMRIKADARTEYRDETLKEDFSDHIRLFDLGLSAGVGVEVRSGKKRVTVEVRYTHGLASVNRFDSENPWRNRALSLLVGVGR